MKKIICFGLLACLLACNNKEKETTTTETTAVEEETETFATAPFVPGSNPNSKLFVWKASPDYTRRRNDAVTPALLNADTLIKGINEINENILLEKVKQSGDTLYTQIKNSNYLGNQMGSTGAEIYVADVVLNLTEVPGIKYVSIEMEEQSHVQPGTWSRKDFEKYKPIY
ncbi:MAG: hypothetical protein EOO03_00330 [Chitinophagaceae bacterium]|nr:MAG: hypothetical protein EOO03_00330 [Chitinophagaceae bacterium]